MGFAAKKVKISRGTYEDLRFLQKTAEQMKSDLALPMKDSTDVKDFVNL